MISRGVRFFSVTSKGEHPWVMRYTTRVGGASKAAWCSGVHPANINCSADGRPPVLRALTFICGEICPLRNQKSYAFLPLNVAIGITPEDMNGEADKTDSILILSSQVDEGLRLRISNEELSKRGIPK
jgi:hypothetical protein